jgi:hypothetical protein
LGLLHLLARAFKLGVGGGFGAGIFLGKCRRVGGVLCGGGLQQLALVVRAQLGQRLAWLDDGSHTIDQNGGGYQC